MEKSELDRSWLFSYFCQKGHTDDMILVYDAGAYYGYLNYQTLLNAVSSGTNDYIITEKYIHKKNDGQIWEHLHVLLKQLEERGIRKQAFIPVFDEQGQLLYFAYEYEKGLSTFYIDIALMELQEKDTLLFFEEAYPRVKNVKVQTMYFPTESRSKTSDEEIRRMHRVFPLEKRCWEAWLDAQNVRKQNSKEFYVRGKSIETKNYGNGKHHIYIIGPCIAMSSCVLREEESIGCILAEKLKEKDYAVECIMYPLHHSMLYEEMIQSLTLMENDIVILIDRLMERKPDYQSDLPVADIIKKRHDDWFWDIPMHATAKGCFEIANAMANWLEPLLNDTVSDDPKCLQMGKIILDEKAQKKLEKYIRQVKECQRIEKGSSVGAIVMNCNPMTRGHLYLIEHARSKVDYLYIFVVQEDKSDFRFEERFAMVKQVTEQFENVIVVPSGEFVLSYATMPLHFEKEEKKEDTLDAAHDLTIFGEYVAKELGITKRFVGEELLDPVTRQYNEAMKRILPNYGIEVEEIKRLETDQGIISASAVRKWIKEDNWEAVKKFVPAAVYSRLRLESGRNNE
ncbi:MAG: adenylyltransferase/cytidyltransferase family protein [Lachnospiraceae bacterium]